MSYVQQLKTVLANPEKAKKLPKWLRYEYYDRAISFNARYSAVGWDGIDVIEQDWDNLFLLDAARYDMLAEVSNSDPTPVISQGSTSWEFLKKNFAGRQLHDTVYVSANPHTYKLGNDVFHNVYTPLSTHWNEDLGTVTPDDMISVAKKAHSEHPHKRLIVHFMQPHFPFLGPSGEDIDMQLSHPDIWATTAQNSEDDDVQLGLNPWYTEILMNSSSPQKLVRAFRENHEIAWDAADKLADELGGLSVASSDHANLVGERLGPLPMPGYGHPPEYYHLSLVTVPWVEIDKLTTRRNTREDPPVIESESMDNEIEDRLEALGYR